MEHLTNFEITGTLNMNGNRITGLTKFPNLPDEGASKQYVDLERNKILSNLPATMDNGSF
jgi:hypothetical protein